MRYLCITYVQKPDGTMDEMMTVTKSIRTNDVQTASVILDFKKLEVVKASLKGESVDRNWDRIVAFYHQYYEATMERLFYENGWEVQKIEVPESTTEITEITETKEE